MKHCMRTYIRAVVVFLLCLYKIMHMICDRTELFCLDVRASYNWTELQRWLVVGRKSVVEVVIVSCAFNLLWNRDIIVIRRNLLHRMEKTMDSSADQCKSPPIEEKTDKLKIVLDNPENTYHSGQKIQGTVYLKHSKIRGK